MNCGENGKKGISCAHQGFFFAGKNTITETKAKLDKYYGNSVCTIDINGKESGLQNFVVAVQARSMPNVLDAQWKSLYPKQLKKFAIWCWPIGD